MTFLPLTSKVALSVAVSKVNTASPFSSQNR
ncbi:MAG: cyclic lactone autoinducer peptide [Clostridia bacterium]|nr:cyclic lactone autoinducer peptide [Clostridia bacterium]